MNLTDNSNSIYQQLHRLKKLTNELKASSLGLDSWLTGLGISGWVRDSITHGLVLLLGLLLTVLILGCVFKCFTKAVEHMMTGVWIAQKKKGGFVEYLESQGHVVNNPGLDCADLIGLGTRRPQGCCELKPMYVAINN